MIVLAALTLIAVVVLESVMAKASASIEGIASIGIICICFLLFSMVSVLDDILQELRK